MVKNHMKRLTAPRTWRILRKVNTFVTRPSPGGHNKNLAVSVNTFLKENAKVSNTTKETKYLLTKQDLLVNGKKKRDYKHQAGFLDVVSMPGQDKHFLVTLDSKGKIVAKPLSKSEAGKTLSRIINKTPVKNKKIQVNLMNGANILVDEKQAKEYKVGDTLIISIPGNKIEKHVKLEKDCKAIVFLGKHSGTHGDIKEIKEDTVTIKTGKETFETKKEYVLVTGKEKPEINIEAK